MDLSNFPALECIVIKHQPTTTGWDALTRLVISVPPPSRNFSIASTACRIRR
jgi:hypothetical protein